MAVQSHFPPQASQPQPSVSTTTVENSIQSFLPVDNQNTTTLNPNNDNFYTQEREGGMVQRNLADFLADESLKSLMYQDFCSATSSHAEFIWSSLPGRM